MLLFVCCEAVETKLVKLETSCIVILTLTLSSLEFCHQSIKGIQTLMRLVIFYTKQNLYHFRNVLSIACLHLF